MKRKTNDLTTQTLLDFDLEESSSDSDFRIEDHDDDSDDCSANSQEDDNKGSDSDDESESDNESDSDFVDSKEKSDKLKAKSPEKAVTLDQLLDQNKGYDKATLKLLATPICCACLGDRSDDTNEIVECDGCGVTVHEGCYGVSDSASVSSTVSSCSTEPWFCEACKAGVEEPDCELCPNKGGIFKETDVGKWVHLVCALYVPGVAFGEVDQLSSVTLFEMPYNKWGAKSCTLCDDARFARTGVVIGCDAGMCKTYFHVTCAQAAGFLSEAHSEEVDQADPFYAHCKIHSDKTLVKHRKRNYHGIKLKAQHRRMEEEQRKLEKPSVAQLRIERKLKKHRKKYTFNKEIKIDPWVPTQKMPRLLSTSATACKKLLIKAELMGIDTAALEFQEAQMTALADVRKKWHIPPAFSVEFIGYYLDRTVRLKDIKKNLQDQLELNKKLLTDQQLLRDKYDETVQQNQEVVKVNERLKDTIEKLHADIFALCPTKQLMPIESIGKPVFNPNVVINTPSSTPPTRTMSVPTAAALKMGVGFPLNNLIGPGKRDDTGRVLSTQCKQNSEELLNECGICKRCSDQHLLAKCDTCHLFYHLGCLNPPLTRHPKKSKLYGWQCSECDKSDDSGPENIMLPKSPRKSRTRYSKDGVLVHDPPECEPEKPKVDVIEAKSKKIESPIKNTLGIDSKELIVELTKILPSETTINNSSAHKIIKRGKKCVPAAKKSLDIILNNVGDKTLDQAEPEMKMINEADIEADPLNEVQEKAIDPLCDPLAAESVEPPILDAIPPSHPSTSEDVIVHVKSKSNKKSRKEKRHHQDSNYFIDTSVNDTAMMTDTYQIPSFLSQNSQLTSEIINDENNMEMSESSHKQNRKKRKEKHRNRSPHSHSDRSPSKEHKRKRKRKNHDMENPNDSKYPIDDRPRIKIKIKAVTDGSNSTTTQIFYVPNDSIDLPPRPMEICKPDPVPESSTKTAALPLPPIKTTKAASSQSVVPSSPIVESEAMTTTPPKTDARRGRGSVGSSPRRSGKSNASTVATAATELACDVCHTAGTAQNLVKCDECRKNYHFCCLEPPVKKTPKRRGYSWHCADCDPTDVENN